MNRNRRHGGARRLVLADLVPALAGGRDHESRSPPRLGIDPWLGYTPMRLAPARRLVEAGSVRLAGYASGTRAMRAFHDPGESTALLRETASMRCDAASPVSVTRLEEGFIDCPIESGPLFDARALAARGR